MKKLATFAFALLLAGSLFAQTGGGTTDAQKAAKAEKKAAKAEKKAAQKEKKKHGDTTTPPATTTPAPTTPPK